MLSLEDLSPSGGSLLGVNFGFVVFVSVSKVSRLYLLRYSDIPSMVLGTWALVSKDIIGPQ